LCEDALVSLVESIKTIGLQTPISVQIDPLSRDERYVLVAGVHRGGGCWRLGMAYCGARIIDLDATQRRPWGISENTHRAELTALERSEHIAEWVRLTEERKGAQLAPPGGQQPYDKGIKAAVRELGVERTEAQRAVKIDSLTPEAKIEAKGLRLDRNQR